MCQSSPTGSRRQSKAAGETRSFLIACTLLLTVDGRS